MCFASRLSDSLPDIHASTILLKKSHPCCSKISLTLASGFMWEENLLCHKIVNERKELKIAMLPGCDQARKRPKLVYNINYKKRWKMLTSFWSLGKGLNCHSLFHENSQNKDVCVLKISNLLRKGKPKCTKQENQF